MKTESKENQMNVGDTVYLKSGSPAMAVQHVERSDDYSEAENPRVETAWFTDTGVMLKNTFPAASLVNKDPRFYR